MIKIIERIFNQYDFNLSYAKQLVEDLNHEQMITSPGCGFENHPAFTLGHLVTGTAMTIEDLGADSEIPNGWMELFSRMGPGDPRLPSEDKEVYPIKSQLITELDRQHERLKQIIKDIPEEKLSDIISWRFSSYMPSMLDLVIFMCINHEAMHLGQLSAWRRAMKLPTALGVMK